MAILTPQEKAAQASTLRLQFPVSSGSHHRAKEDEWVPVEPKPAPPAATLTATTGAVVPANKPAAATTSHATTAFGVAAEVAAAATTNATEAAGVKPEDKVFPDPPPEVNISLHLISRNI